MVIWGSQTLSFQRRDGQKTNKKYRTFCSTAWQRAKFQPHQTWHDDRGGPPHFARSKICPPPTHSFAARGHWKLLGKRPRTWLNPYNFGIPWPNSTKFYTPIRETTLHTRWKFCRNQARETPRWGIYIKKFRKIFSFGGLMPTYASILAKFGMEEWTSFHSSMPNFAKISATSRLCGAQKSDFF